MLKNRTVIKMDLDLVEKWAKRYLKKFRKAKENLCKWRNVSCNDTRWRLTCWEKAQQKRTWGLVGNEMSQQCPGSKDSQQPPGLH